MRSIRGASSLITLLALGCGSDEPSPGDGSTGTPPATTVMLPTSAATDAATTHSDSSADDSLDATADDTAGILDTSEEPFGDCDPLQELAGTLSNVAPEQYDQEIDSALRTMLYGEHGLPGVENTLMCVAYRGAPGQTISVAGDFNDWAPEDYPLDELVPGYYQGLIALPEPPQGLYKLVIGGTEFIGDPLARRFGWDEFGEYSQVDAMADRGHHERWPQFPGDDGVIAARTLTAFIPQGAEAARDLPVLYMHDGQNLFSPDAPFGYWRASETLQAQIDLGAVQPLVLLGIDNTPARFDEYTPQADVLEGMRVGGNAEQYTAWLTDSVMPFVEERYPIALDAANTGVMGSSLGGLVSLYIGLSRPDLFGYVGSMSGTIDWGTLGADNPTIDEMYQGMPPTGLHIYLDSGGSGGTGCPDGGTDNYCGNVRMLNTLVALGWVEGTDLVYRWAPGEGHNEAAWAARLGDALVDWFPGG